MKNIIILMTVAILLSITNMVNAEEKKTLADDFVGGECVLNA